MKVNVLFFSVLKDLTGTAETPWPIQPGTTLNHLLEELYQHWPALKEWDQSLLLAINQEYSPRETLLPNHAEIAIMPPVQGG
ncbi:MoaD/ThiS family protein [Phragmitibacter flavus]|uniref:MoaD/ThiS family protein n=1 Tax=Phragmitibacter flavus TaxID=2576071 RepID=UPI0014099597|nr:MoaD/ThiS family protein [Phragmitibacter flavus]